MRSLPRRIVLAAVALAALLLVLVLLRVQRAPDTADEVITHEVRDLIATLQEPLEAGDTTPWSARKSPGLTGFAAALLASFGLTSAVWMWRRRRRDHERPRNSSS